MNRLRILDLPADRIDGEAVAAFFYQDERPILGPAALLDWRLNGLLTNLLIEGRAQGKAGENILVRNNGKLASDWIFFMGGGSRSGIGPEACRGLLRHFLQTSLDAGFGRITLCLDSMGGVSKSDLEGMMMDTLEDMGRRYSECRISFFDQDAGTRK